MAGKLVSFDDSFCIFLIQTLLIVLEQQLSADFRREILSASKRSFPIGLQAFRIMIQRLQGIDKVLEFATFAGATDDLRHFTYNDVFYLPAECYAASADKNFACLALTLIVKQGTN